MEYISSLKRALIRFAKVPAKHNIFEINSQYIGTVAIVLTIHELLMEEDCKYLQVLDSRIWHDTMFRQGVCISPLWNHLL